ncbi:hypothetical protein PCL_10465 [Purpureocillium lilacinum]|uniref:Uncharacterized protein n=1 Tax=Purpureocillium lilacinum TaxID=33203 RepID=A0A2U3DQD2_PURLI|nr:hypothetical protein PCL_10465 [Purpureocillium lilacinum]
MPIDVATMGLCLETVTDAHQHGRKPSGPVLPHRAPAHSLGCCWRRRGEAWRFATARESVMHVSLPRASHVGSWKEEKPRWRRQGQLVASRDCGGGGRGWVTTDDGTDATQRSRRDLGGGEKQTGPSGGVEVAVPDPGLGKAPAALRLPSCRRDRPGVGTPPGQELDRSAFLLGTTHTHEPRTSAQYEARGANAVQACRSACSSSPSHARYLLSPFAPAHTHKGYGDLVLDEVLTGPALLDAPPRFMRPGGKPKRKACLTWRVASRSVFLVDTPQPPKSLISQSPTTDIKPCKYQTPRICSRSHVRTRGLLVAAPCNSRHHAAAVHQSMTGHGNPTAGLGAARLASSCAFRMALAGGPCAIAQSSNISLLTPLAPACALMCLRPVSVAKKRRAAVAINQFGRQLNRDGPDEPRSGPTRTSLGYKWPRASNA